MSWSGRKRSRPEEEEAELLAMAVARSLEGSWDCQLCGETNSHEAQRCTRPRCGSFRGRGAAAAAAAGAEEIDLASDSEEDTAALTQALVHSLVGTWDCRQCGEEANPPNAERCTKASCRAYRERAAGQAATAEAESDAATSLGGAESCGLPGCSAPRRDGCFGFCKPEHRTRAAQEGWLAPDHPNIERVYTGQSGEWTAHLMTKQHPARPKIINDFQRAWKKHAVSGHPAVQRVYAIRAPPTLYSSFRARSAARGEVVDRYHGTGLAAGCNFGVDQQARPCFSPDCGICNICRAGFRLDRADSNPARPAMSLRFGKGLYFSATSGKSHDYNLLSERPRRIATHGVVPWRCT